MVRFIVISDMCSPLALWTAAGESLENLTTMPSSKWIWLCRAFIHTRETPWACITITHRLKSLPEICLYTSTGPDRIALHFKHKLEWPTTWKKKKNTFHFHDHNKAILYCQLILRGLYGPGTCLSLLGAYSTASKGAACYAFITAESQIGWL